MRQKKARPWLAATLALVLVLGIPITAGAADMGATANWSSWGSFRAIAEMPALYVIGSEKEWTFPDTDGKYVVYQRRLVDGNGTLPGTTPGDWNIYVQNLNTGAVVPVTEAAGDQVFPRISGDWIVYTDQAGASNEVKAFKISSRTPKTITNRALDQNSPDISGNLIAYEDNGTVRLYDLSTGADTLMANPGAEPAISGPHVVYKQGGLLKLNDIVEENVVTIDADGANEWEPRIDGDYVVYMDELGALDFDIIAYTISTDSSKSIATGGSKTYAYPDVDGTIAVWEAYEGAEPFLQAYDFVKDRVVSLGTLAPVHLTLPKVSGNRVVCVSSATSFLSANGDIQLGIIKAPVATLTGSSVVYYGSRPTLRGRLTEDGQPLGGKTLDVLRSTNGGLTYAKVGTLVSEEDGDYSYRLPATYTTVRYQVRYNGELFGFGGMGNLSRFSALSDVKTVKVRASIGRPKGYPSTGNDTKTYSVYGSLKPQQTASAAADGVVVVKCYRRQSGKWKLRKTVNAKVYDYDTYSRYRASVKLPYTGRWRLRAYFKGSSINADKSSSYRYVRVR